MDAYQQYRAWAEERLRQAQQVPEEHRIVLLEMACTLFRIADDARSWDADWQPLDPDLPQNWRSLPHPEQSAP